MYSYAEVVKKGRLEREVREELEKKALDIKYLEQELEKEKIKKDFLTEEIEAQKDKESLARFKKVAKDHYFHLDYDEIGRIYMSNSQFVLFYVDWRRLGENTWRFL